MTNPYAPPLATVRDIVDPNAQVVPADRGTRLGAAILDGIVFMVLVYAPMLVGGIGGAAVANASGDRAPGILLGAGLIFALVGFVVWCFFTLRYVSRNGQSIAKKMLGIKVVRADGTPVSLGRVFWLRNVVNGIISIVPLYGIVDVLFIFSESRQCLHDKLADTKVVNA